MNVRSQYYNEVPYWKTYCAVLDEDEEETAFTKGQGKAYRRFLSQTRRPRVHVSKRVLRSAGPQASCCK